MFVQFAFFFREFHGQVVNLPDNSLVGEALFLSIVGHEQLCHHGSRLRPIEGT
jgi:hypothetical protein